MSYKDILYEICFFCILLFLIFNHYNIENNLEHFETNIPLNLFNTWEYKELPPKMQESVDKLKNDNPEFNYYLFDNNDRREFIIKHFDNDVLYAYDTLIPGAFKADLFRYCVLYIMGGIYLDIKYYPINGFKLISLTDKEYFVRDIEPSGAGIYNAFIICKQGNKKMYNCIYKIVNNVKNKFYGNSVFEPTGPLLLLTEFTEEELKNLPNIGLSELDCPTKTCISLDNKPILAIYKEYRDEQKYFFIKENTKYYYDLWLEKKIYVE